MIDRNKNAMKFTKKNKNHRIFIPLDFLHFGIFSNLLQGLELKFYTVLATLAMIGLGRVLNTSFLRTMACTRYSVVA